MAQLLTSLTRQQHAHINVLFAKNGGKLSNEQLLHAAEAQDSPIHDLFVWDNKRAAHLYRLRQAARILRSYVAWIPRKKATGLKDSFAGRPLAFHVRPTEKEGATWVKAADAMEDEYMYSQVVAAKISHVRNSIKQLLVVPALEPLYNRLENAIAKFVVRYEKPSKEKDHVRK